jgi:hypothetical protein
VRAYATNSAGTAYGDGVSFMADPTLTITLIGNLGADAVTSTPAGINCPGSCEGAFDADQAVTLDVTVDPSSTFQGWSGDCAVFGAALSGSITLDACKDCTATFRVAYSRGDVDGDVDIDMFDVRMILQIAAGDLAGTPEQMSAADVDQDGDVDRDDAAALAEYVIGMADSLP